jgi:HEAT repeat protein
LCVQLLAEVAKQQRWIWRPIRPVAVQQELQKALPLLVGFLTDPDVSVRRVTPYAICKIAEDGSGLAGAIRDQAGVEDDALALAGQVRALDEISLGTIPLTWFLPYLEHPSPDVRLAAVGAVARRRSPSDGPALAEVASDLLEHGERLWMDSPWKPPCSSATTSWLASRLAEHPEDGANFALAAFGAKDLQTRRAAPKAAARVLNRWRQPMRPLWDALTEALSHPDGLVSSAAAETVWCGGEAIRPYATVLYEAAVASVASDAISRSSSVADHTIAALATLGDGRVIPLLSERLARDNFYWHSIRLSEVLIPLRDHAALLVPAIRGVLRCAPRRSGECLLALAAWGPASAEAVPELLELLHTEHAAASCIALGRVGADARAAAEILEMLALGRRKPPRPTLRPAPVWHGTQHAAWAHWRVTGNPGVALKVLGEAVRRGLGHAMLPHLAQLGPLAAAYAPDVRRLLDLPGQWSRVEAAHAWWRITGDPGPAVPVLLEAAQPLWARRLSPEIRAAVRYLGEIGNDARAALPLLDSARTGDRRCFDPRGSRTIRDDEALVRQATNAARQIRDR